MVLYETWGDLLRNLLEKGKNTQGRFLDVKQTVSIYSLSSNVSFRDLS